MKRALVLTTESARHPFRQWLPPHVLQIAPEPKQRQYLAAVVRVWSACFTATLIFLL
jgi:hypothetical protein